MATFNISPFTLASTYTAYLNSVTLNTWISPDPPRVATKNISLNIGAIPNGSTIVSAVVSATYSVAARTRTIKVGSSAEVAFGGAYNAKAALDALNGVYGTLPISFSYGANGSTSGATVGGTAKTVYCPYSNVKLVVEYIEPASTLTLNKSSCPAGGTLRATITKKLSTAQHYLTFTRGAESFKTAKLASSVGYYDFEIPLEWQETIPNNTSGTIVVKLETYDGATKTGDESKNCTMTLSDDAYPSFSEVTAALDRNGVPEAITKYVQTKSKVDLAIVDAAGVYGSTITAYKIEGNDEVISAVSGKTGPLKAYGDITFTATVTDSRGRTKSADVVIHAEVYRAPSIKNILAYRSDDEGTEDGVGTYIYLFASADISSVGGQNTAALYGRYGLVGQAYNDWGALGTGLLLGAGALAVNKTYSAQIRIVDLVGLEYIFTATIPQEAVGFNIRNGGGGAAFGKYADTDDLLEVAWSKMTVKNPETSAQSPVCTYDVGDLYITIGDTNPNNKYPGTTWERFAKGRMLVGQDWGETPDEDFETVEATGGDKAHVHDLSPGAAMFTYGTGIATQSAKRITTAEWTNNFKLTAASNNVGDTASKPTSGTGLIGDTASGSSMPPYIVVKMWVRTF